MKNLTVKKYETPELSVMVVKVERGYAASSTADEGINAVRNGYGNSPDNNQVWS